MHGFGPVVTADGDATHHEAWELRAQVLTLLSAGGMRDALEHLDPATYLGSSYYQRWLRAGEIRLVERGAITTDELAAWHDRLADDPGAAPAPTSDPAMVELIRGMGPTTFETAPSATFDVGDAVRVRRMRPERHHRCPRYVRGAPGVIERVIGLDRVPGAPSDQPVTEVFYTVGFDSIDLFGASADEPPFELFIDLCDRYLEQA
jgi:nitrile hydratase